MRYTFEINNCKTVHFGELLQLKHPNLRIFVYSIGMNLRIFVYSIGMNLRIFVYFMEINLRIFNIIRIFALRKYQIVRNFYIKNKEKEYMNRIFKRKLYDRLPLV